MSIILSDNMLLEKVDKTNNEHKEIIKKINKDNKIKKYIIGILNDFDELISYYDLYNNEMFNNVYFVRYNNIIVGTIELVGCEDDLYINYAILEEYRGQNIGTKMLRLITLYLLNIVKKITLSIKESNVESIALASKIGYKPNNNKFLGYIDYQITSLPK
ncbi:MAG: GNAT family N-acetyltransferase [Bacilli bacterium]|nr:GNAT family N-acetyltransferase [Bacilli bacterium]